MNHLASYILIMLQSYTLKNTANKPRVVIKSNGSSYIPLKAGTDTKATRLGFNINGAHYKAGGETSTTSIQSNTTYTYFGAQTYKSSTYNTSTIITIYSNTKYSGSSTMTSNWARTYSTTSSKSNYNFDYSHVTTQSYGRFADNPKAGYTITTHYTSNFTTNQPSGDIKGTFSILTSLYMNLYRTEERYTSRSISARSVYGMIVYTYAFRQYIQYTGTMTATNMTAYCTIGTGPVTATSSYDYGYNVNVGNTTTTVQTTTEV